VTKSRADWHDKRGTRAADASPFDRLATEALEEHRRGETIPFEKLKAEFRIERRD